MFRRPKPIFRRRRRYRATLEILALAIGLLTAIVLLAATVSDLSR
jgi:hypothetical protein